MSEVCPFLDRGIQLAFGLYTSKTLGHFMPSAREYAND